MPYAKHELIAKLGDPAEEHVQPDTAEPGKPVSILRWECGCGARKAQDELLWDWDPGECVRHASGLPAT